VPGVRVLLWHGWLLEGSGSNVYAARTAEVLRADGHDVALVCQEPHPERYAWIDAWGRLAAGGPSSVVPNPAASPSARGGRCVLLRPTIGRLLPVFVIDEYEGFEVRRFLDLADGELDAYLDANVEALRALADGWAPDAVVAGHAVPGGAIARRAFGAGRYAVKVHGSDVEYAIRPQDRYRALASEGLDAAATVVGASADVLRRCEELLGPIAAPTEVVPPGVDAATFRPRERGAALGEAAAALDDAASEAALGRPAALDGDVRAALRARDADALDRFSSAYDQRVPDPGAASALRALAGRRGPLVGSFGKLIPQKGVEHLLVGARLAASPSEVLVVGFGLHREWLAALDAAIHDGDADALGWLRGRGVVPPDVDLGRLAAAGAAASPAVFTGRLDHRFAPAVVAAMDVLVVPSVLEEAFGMVAAEGAAAGAIPLVARHSGLAEVAAALEDDVGRPGLCSYEPGDGAVRALARGLDRLLALDVEERRVLRSAVAAAAASRWSWRTTAARLLAAAGS
jgi:glycosyltransferase involved in cell wall biosynthesis